MIISAYKSKTVLGLVLLFAVVFGIFVFNSTKKQRNSNELVTLQGKAHSDGTSKFPVNNESTAFWSIEIHQVSFGKDAMRTRQLATQSPAFELVTNSGTVFVNSSHAKVGLEKNSQIWMKSEELPVQLWSYIRKHAPMTKPNGIEAQWSKLREGEVVYVVAKVEGNQAEAVLISTQPPPEFAPSH